ncbi:MAG: hypothetical protein ACTTH7_09700 [Treponema sp.]
MNNAVLNNAILWKKIYYGFAVCSFVAGMLVFLPLMQSCELADGFNKNAFTLTDPLPENRDPIALEDSFGSYSGELYLKMDGKKYGPFNETVKVGRDLYGKYYFYSKEVDYGTSMPVNIRYHFKEIKLDPAQDGKSIAFTGKNGIVYYHDKQKTHGDQGLEAGRNTKIDGRIYKIQDTVYITFNTVYDTADLKRLVPQLKGKGHDTMSGSTTAKKQ